MIFNYRTLFAQLAGSLFGTRGTTRRLTARRIRFFAIFSVLFIYGQVSSWVGLLLDHILFPRFRRVDLTGKTLFIVGNFRSGSTFLHRMLAEDTRTFTALSTWEIYLAPSISQRKLYRGMKIVDSWFGSPAYRRLTSWDANFLQAVPLHSVSLWKPEEDVGLLLYVWYSFFSWFFFPDWKAIEPIARFDQHISAPRRRRVVEFYAGCLKRHLYVHGESKIIVSKNPSFSGMIDSLQRYLPDAKFIGLARPPVDTVASTIGWLSFAWHFFADPIEEFPFKTTVIELVQTFYACIRDAERLDPATYRTILFSTLVGETISTVESIYEFLGCEEPDRQRLNVRRDSERVKKHAPDARTRLELIGLSSRWLAEVFHDTIVHYGFASAAGGAGEPKQMTGSERDVGISSIRAVD